MTTTEPAVSPTGLYELRDAARLLGVSKASVLRWTRQGHMPCSIRKANNRRVWTGQTILRMWKIKM